MRLVIVGCSGSFAGPQSPASAYLLQVPADIAPDGREWNVLLDLGSGALGSLQRFVDPRVLDAVAISHLHPDHFVDLCGLYVCRRYHPGGAEARHQDPLPVWGPSGTDARLAATYGLGPGENMDAHFAVRPWEPGTPVTIGPLTIEPMVVRHPIPAYGFRVTGPSSVRPGERAVLGYTGDTDTCPSLLELAHDVDLLLSEAAFQEGRDDHVERGIHLTGRRAGQVATDAGAHRLVLTHLPAWNDPEVVWAEAADVYMGPIDMATAGAVFTL